MEIYKMNFIHKRPWEQIKLTAKQSQYGNVSQERY